MFVKQLIRAKIPQQKSNQSNKALVLDKQKKSNRVDSKTLVLNFFMLS